MQLRVKKGWGMPLAAGCALVALSAAATEIVSQPFETPETDVTALSAGAVTWAGYGTIQTGSVTYTEAAGRPIAADATSNPQQKVLAVEGQVTLTAATEANKSAQVDLMVQIAAPEDELTLPSSEANPQIAVGVEKPGSDSAKADLKIYCTLKNNTKGWATLKTMTIGDWVRVSFLFDYAAGLCQVRLNGEPVLTTAGYLTTDTTSNADASGAWYKLATAGTQLSSVKVIGSTLVDDMVVKSNDTSYPLAEVADTALAELTGSSVVPLAWYDEQGIAWSSSAKYDDSGLTVEQKYIAGLTPTDGKKFELTKMSAVKNEVTLTFNAANPPTGYKYVIETKGTEGDWAAHETVVPADKGTWTGSFDTSNVLYYRLSVVKTN